MATNKERIELLEATPGRLKDNMSHIELGVDDKLYQLENAINRISKAILEDYDSTTTHAF